MIQNDYSVFVTTHATHPFSSIIKKHSITKRSNVDTQKECLEISSNVAFSCGTANTIIKKKNYDCFRVILIDSFLRYSVLLITLYLYNVSMIHAYLIFFLSSYFLQFQS